MQLIRFGIERWEICAWQECRAHPSCFRNTGRGDIEIWLRRFSSEQLRSLLVLHDSHPPLLLSRCDDREIIRRLAALFAVGRLRICRLIPERTEGGRSEEAPPAPEPPPPPPPKRSSAPVSPPPPEPSTFPPNFDPAAAADTLKEAAKDGVPFCEECMKGQDATSAVSAAPSGFPPNFDADAAAETLMQAAAEGVPFCEECLREAASETSS